MSGTSRYQCLRYPKLRLLSQCFFYCSSKTTDAVALATPATTQTIEAACSCAAEHLGENNPVIVPVGDSVGQGKDNLCHHKFLKNIKKFVDSSWFIRVIMTSIFLNTICMAVEHHGQVFLANIVA